MKHQAWADARAELLNRGAVPSIRLLTDTERSRTEIPFTVDVEVIEIAKGARPYGPRFGTLVHSILAAAPLDGGDAEIAATSELQGRVLGAKDDEVKAAITTVTAALQHPLMQRARAAAENGECYRELPLTLRMEDGTLIEGVADLVFREGGRGSSLISRPTRNWRASYSVIGDRYPFTRRRSARFRGETAWRT